MAGVRLWRTSGRVVIPTPRRIVARTSCLNYLRLNENYYVVYDVVNISSARFCFFFLSIPGRVHTEKPLLKEKLKTFPKSYEVMKLCPNFS